MGRKRGRERERVKAGRSILEGKIFEVLFRETIMEEGGRCQLSWSCYMLEPYRDSYHGHAG